MIFVTSIGERYAVQFRSRIALTRQRDDTACQTSQTRDPKQGAQKGAVLRANDVVVAERRVEVLRFICVTKTQRQIELVGNVDDIVSEERKVFALLIVHIARAAKIVDLGQIVQAGKNQRGCGTKRARTAVRGQQRCASTSA